MNNQKNDNILLSILCFSIMIIIGYIGNLRGFLIPYIKQDLGINYTSIGNMLIISSIGYFASTFLGGFIGDKLGQKKVIILGYILLTTGIVGVAKTNGFLFIAASMFLLNLGLGSFDIGINSLAPKIFISNTAVMMSIMHVFFGVGSSLSPKFASWMMTKGISWNNVYFYSLIIVAVAFVFFTIIPPIENNSIRVQKKIPLKRLLFNRRIWLFIGVLGFCESTELGIENWLINFLQVERGMSAGISAQYMFYFFITYTIGRIFGGFIAERMGYIRTVLSFVAVSIALFSGGLFLGNWGAVLFSLTGFFISIMFPTMITAIAKEFTDGTSTVIGVVMTSAGLICMASNWIIGKINDSIGVSTGFASILVYAAFVVLFLCLLKIDMASRRYCTFSEQAS